MQTAVENVLNERKLEIDIFFTIPFEMKTAVAKRSPLRLAVLHEN
jgi:hypothetical protein